ncbi:hypothetical protein TD95_002304 [Thielaviopsis punctulata]|uniref:Uncharacterized protein n=1 Tax=Thielaviopsis punctulata TaxID=72032 RepID=A0A0F4ZAK8_9PEZI|nr:hypothetical protein TD95_002304 [Thielaviopsis punctulata]
MRDSLEKRTVKNTHSLTNTYLLTHLHLLELQNYHILGHILRFAPYHAPLLPARVLTTFDFLCFIVEIINGIGASYSANTGRKHSQTDAGHILAKASLLLQLAILPSFVWLTAAVHWRCCHSGVLGPRLPAHVFVVLHVSAALLLARTVYRVVKYFQLTDAISAGRYSDASVVARSIRYEVFFSMLEASLMLVNVALFNVQHPRMVLPENNDVYLTRDG